MIEGKEKRKMDIVETRLANPESKLQGDDFDKLKFL